MGVGWWGFREGGGRVAAGDQYGSRRMVFEGLECFETDEAHICTCYNEIFTDVGKELVIFKSIQPAVCFVFKVFCFLVWFLLLAIGIGR